MFLKSGDGREAESLAISDYTQVPTSVSQDGKHLLYDWYAPGKKGDILLLPMTGKPVPFLSSEDSEWGSRFSPDGQYVAYTSDESGQHEVYVQPFPGPGGKLLISTNGGTSTNLFAIEGQAELEETGVDSGVIVVEIPVGHVMEPVLESKDRAVAVREGQAEADLRSEIET